MGFLSYKIVPPKRGSDTPVVRPVYNIHDSSDIVTNGDQIVAWFDPRKGVWTRDVFDITEMIDQGAYAFRDEHAPDAMVSTLDDWTTGEWSSFRRYVKELPTRDIQFDTTIRYAGEPSEVSDHSTKTVPYSIADGDPVNWNRLLEVLYTPEDIEKIEWAFGAVLSNHGMDIDKLFLFYGAPGTGKSTLLGILAKLAEGYTVAFRSGDIMSKRGQFDAAVFASGVPIAIDDDADLESIRTDGTTVLNQIASHAVMDLDRKYKSSISVQMRSVMFIASNSPIRVPNSRSGILRRLVDVRTTGRILPSNEYDLIMRGIDTELGAIANQCINRYLSMGNRAYESYRSTFMAETTNMVRAWLDEAQTWISEKDEVKLGELWADYKSWASNAQVTMMSKPELRFELTYYFDEYIPRTAKARHVYRGLRLVDGDERVYVEGVPTRGISLEEGDDLLVDILGDCPAQYANGDIPEKPWDVVTTTLKDLDTTRLHFVRVPENHIVVDFDIRDEDGNKSLERNLAAAASYPLTYAEVSKSGGGLHLHYWYDGDVADLAPIISEGVECKVYRGKSALRRVNKSRFDHEVAHISSGLPRKEKATKPAEEVKNEAHARRLIEKALRKEIHPSTRCNVDFIKKVVDELAATGRPYDVTDMKPKATAFAAQSTNQRTACLRIVRDIPWATETSSDESGTPSTADELPIIFFDVESFPNLFVLCWKSLGSENVVKMLNPTSEEVTRLVNSGRLVGFNNRRYDNHILYAAMNDYSPEDIHKVSNKLIAKARPFDGSFGEAYSLSYTDVYDYSSKKQSLKKWEIELGIFHLENSHPWDEPLDEQYWEEVAAYCANDVIATEAVWNATREDFEARQILADLAGMDVNRTTNTLTQQIIFGDDRNPPFNHVDLQETFPGYEFSFGKSTYKGVEVGEGGYVYSEPGEYHDVALLDIASMHPHSAIALNVWGDEYTKRFKELVDGRIFVKHHDSEKAVVVLNGALKPYLGDEESEDKLAAALKIPINSVYGLTAASFPNRANGGDPAKNKDNIIAKRGALFMVALKEACAERGIHIIHIKTDSVKIPNATEDDIRFVMEFGAKYGYTFEHEATYSKLILFNDAVYIAKDDSGWHATGAMFQHPYVFKSLLSHEDFVPEDFYETKSVTTALYLNYGTPEEPIRKFVGGVGRFVPVTKGGGILEREKDGEFHSASGAKGHRWAPAGSEQADDYDGSVDLGYFESLADAARAEIERVGGHIGGDE